MEKQGLKFVQMLGPANPMRGGCGDTVKAVGNMVAGHIAGQFGQNVFNEVWQTGEEIINGEEYSVPSFNQIFNGTTVGNAAGTFGVGKNNTPIQTLGQAESNIRFENLKNWFFNKFEPWVDDYISPDIKNLPNDQYRQRINEILLNLEALRLLYQEQAISETEEISLTQGKGGVADNLDIVQIYNPNADGVRLNLVNFEELKTKSDAFAFLADTIRRIFEKRMKKREVELFTKKLKNFDPTRYNVNGPENLNTEGLSRTDVEMYVFDENDQLDVTYQDGDEVEEDEQVDEISGVTSFIDSISKPNAALTVVGVLIAGAYGFKKLRGSAKK